MMKEEIESDIVDIEDVTSDLSTARRALGRLNEMSPGSELDQANDLIHEAIDKLESSVVELQERAELVEEESEEGDE